MTPVRAPPQRQPEACPHSWNSAESTDRPTITSRSTGSRRISSRASTLTSTATTSGHRNSGRSTVPTALASTLADSRKRTWSPVSSRPRSALTDSATPAESRMPSMWLTTWYSSGKI
jgi:hypothetical protein